MLERWELSHFPYEKDKDRYKLRLKAEEADVMDLVKKIPLNCGRPFVSLSQKYNYALYIYQVSDGDRKVLVQSLESLCSEGKVSEAKLSSDKELPGMLEDFLEAAADSLTQDDKGAPAKAKPEPEPKAKKSKVEPTEISFDIDPEEAEKRLEKEIELQNKKEPKKRAKRSDEPLESEETVIPFPPQKEESKRSLSMEETMSISLDAPMASKESTPPDTWKDPLAEPEPAKAKGKSHKAAESPGRSYPPPTLNPRFTFEDFIVGPNNRFTQAAAMAVADNPGRIYNPLFIYGGVGLGKTHLMHAIGHAILKKNPEAKLIYTTAEKFTSELIDAIGKGTIQQFREFYRQADVILIDDVQFLQHAESTQEEFFHTFNLLHENNKQILLTSDRPPKLLTTLEDRLRSRFEWGLIADVKVPNLETRVAILKKKEGDEKLSLDPTILHFIAGKLKSNIRELEGFLKRLSAMASLNKQVITMELAEEAMKETHPEEEVPVPEAPPAAKAAPAAPAAPPQAAPVPQRGVAPPPPPKLTPIPTSPPEPKAPVQASNSFSASASDDGDDEDDGLKPIAAAFFYPDGAQAELEKVKEKFKEVIKKHKLKFKLKSALEKGYSPKEQVDYSALAGACKSAGVKIAVVVGPPPKSALSEDDFTNILTSVMEEEKISLQLIPYAEMSKDYRYLNMALDITLLSSKTAL